MLREYPRSGPDRILTKPCMLGALEAMLGTPNATTLVNGPIAGVY